MESTNSQNQRPSWDEFWFTLALFYSTRGTCDRLKAACLLIDKNNRLVGAGYNGSLPGHPHCDEAGHLMVDGHCLRTLHAEVNAIMHSVGDLEGATAYVLGTPCIDCVKKLLAKKVKKIFFTRDYDNQARGGEYIFDLAKTSGAEMRRVDVDFTEVLSKEMTILTGTGGAFFGQNYGFTKPTQI
ncbi:MAG: CMP deaminase [Candidatus Nealsonbacteria bacterium]|nr:CMP deaminase [Candidatus Nealsonbacteria bacterium]